jgi:hypothetical protein
MVQAQIPFTMLLLAAAMRMLAYATARGVGAGAAWVIPDLLL